MSYRLVTPLTVDDVDSDLNDFAFATKDYWQRIVDVKRQLKEIKKEFG